MCRVEARLSLSSSFIEFNERLLLVNGPSATSNLQPFDYHRDDASLYISYWLLFWFLLFGTDFLFKTFACGRPVTCIKLPSLNIEISYFSFPFFLGMQCLESIVSAFPTAYNLSISKSEISKLSFTWMSHKNILTNRVNISHHLKPHWIDYLPSASKSMWTSLTL